MYSPRLYKYRDSNVLYKPKTYSTGLRFGIPYTHSFSTDTHTWCFRPLVFHFFYICVVFMRECSTHFLSVVYVHKQTCQSSLWYRKCVFMPLIVLSTPLPFGIRNGIIWTPARDKFEYPPLTLVTGVDWPLSVSLEREGPVTVTGRPRFLAGCWVDKSSPFLFDPTTEDTREVFFW